MGSSETAPNNVNSVAGMTDHTFKPTPDHIENLANDINEKPTSENIEEELKSNSEEAAFNVEMPSNYFMTPRVLGTLLAGGLGMFGGTGSFAFAASILDVINEDIGPDPNYVWIGTVNTLMIAVGSTLVGRLTDIFGRRWFIVTANGLGLIGCIVCSQAKSITTLIGANVMVGLAASAQTSFAFVIGELVPMKHRYMIGGIMYLFSLPAAGFGPAVANGLVQHTSGGWRWCYYIMIIVNACSTLCFFLFYHPPTFHMLSKKSRFQQLLELDYVGLVLFTGGLIAFLLGLSWGGTVHPWNSGHVIGSLVAGGVALITFVLYECLMPLKKSLVPMHLFKNLGWVVAVATNALGASIYYGFSIIFPQMVFGIYTTDRQYGAILCCAVPASFMFGVIAASLLNRHIGRQKLQDVVCSAIFTPLLGAMACATVENKSVILGLVITGCAFVGWVETLAVVGATLSLDDQAEIGAASGIASTIRATTATFATTIYVLVLKNRLETTIPEKLLPALAKTELPQSSYLSFISGLSTGSFTGIPGISATIIAEGVGAYQQALVLAFRTVFLTTLAFSGLNLILSVFFPNLDSKMTNTVTRTIHR